MPRTPPQCPMDSILRMLQSAGVVWREQAETIPPAVTYGLTPRCNDLRGVLDAMGEIAER